MERLTEPMPGCFSFGLKDHKPVTGEFATYDAFFDYSMAVKRLGEYENLGTPEQLAARVEVVRCGECRKKDTWECPAGDYLHSDSDRITTVLDNDDFCSYGERRED